MYPAFPLHSKSLSLEVRISLVLMVLSLKVDQTTFYGSPKTSRIRILSRSFHFVSALNIILWIIGAQARKRYWGSLKKTWKDFGFVSTIRLQEAQWSWTVEPCGVVDLEATGSMYVHPVKTYLFQVWRSSFQKMVCSMSWGWFYHLSCKVFHWWSESCGWTPCGHLDRLL